MMNLSLSPRILLPIAFLATACMPTSETETPSATGSQQTLSVADALGGGFESVDPRFARALEPRPFVFPADHGAHPEFRIEWWYVTGHLESDTGRPFGFQLTFFRTALRPPEPSADYPAKPEPSAEAITASTRDSTNGFERTSDWATDQFYFAHFAVTDPRGERFIARSRSQRGAVGLAGVQAEPFKVWVGPWRAQHEPADSESGRSPAPDADGVRSLFPLRLDAEHDGAAIDLLLTAERTVTLHGDNGLSQKGREAGNASYYLSWTRCPIAGRLRIESDTFEVTGSAWIDREWSTSVLPPGVVGWDWFSLQLADGRDLMLFQLRNRSGQPGEVEGTMISNSRTSRLSKDVDVRLQPGRGWTSPVSGATYPVEWSIEIPAEDIRLTLEPLLDAQELNVGFRYWEGAMIARAMAPAGSDATADGRRPVIGRGYLEMTGYETQPPQ